MASSNNPRKFSEKIALHNQKQAEETAAFEEVMKDLNITRAARVRRVHNLRLFTFCFIAVFFYLLLFLLLLLALFLQRPSAAEVLKNDETINRRRDAKVDKVNVNVLNVICTGATPLNHVFTQPAVKAPWPC